MKGTSKKLGGTKLGTTTSGTLSGEPRQGLRPEVRRGVERKNHGPFDVPTRRRVALLPGPRSCAGRREGTSTLSWLYWVARSSWDRARGLPSSRGEVDHARPAQAWMPYSMSALPSPRAPQEQRLELTCAFRPDAPPKSWRILGATHRPVRDPAQGRAELARRLRRASRRQQPLARQERAKFWPRHRAAGPRGIEARSPPPAAKFGIDKPAGQDFFLPLVSAAFRRFGRVQFGAAIENGLPTPGARAKSRDRSCEDHCRAARPFR